jgi:hypothetical protein
MTAVREGRNQAGDRVNVTSTDSEATLTSLPGAGYLSVMIKATAFTGVITFEVTDDDTNWNAIELMTTADMTDTSLITTATNITAGMYVSKGAISCSGFRAKCSTFTSQTAAFVSVRWSR